MPLTLPNGKPSYATHPGVDTSNPVNPIARYANCGYKRYYKNNFNVLLSAEQNLISLPKDYRQWLRFHMPVTLMKDVN